MPGCDFSEPAARERAIENVRRLAEQVRQDFAASGQSKPRTFDSVGIVGAGLMGTAIAAANVIRGLRVVISDSNREALSCTRHRIAAQLARHTELPREEINRRIQRLVEPTDAVDRLAACDIVLESIVETAAAKQDLYARLVPHLGPGAILATNTSTIPISRLSASLPDPGRFCGIHFLRPDSLRVLVEIVRGPQTTDETIAAASDYLRAIDRMPIVVADGPGFLVNRLLVPYLNEALEMLLEGASIEALESAAESMMQIGPLRIMDEIGLDTALLAGSVLWEAFPQRVIASPLLITLIKKGRLGRKAGKGFFRYESDASWGDPGQPDPAVTEIIAGWARPPKAFTREMILARLLLPMILEATRLLEEGKVRDPRDIDRAAVFGLGLRQDRGGFLYWADTLGARQIVQMLQPLAALGPRAEPTKLLLEMAARGGRFYEEG